MLLSVHGVGGIVSTRNSVLPHGKNVTMATIPAVGMTAKTGTTINESTS
jgi:hypothetical protein